ncbi:MAG: Hint domain-containing protein [Pseudomonadota bacterium]
MQTYRFGIYSFEDLGVPPYTSGGDTYPPIATIIQQPNQTYAASETAAPDRVVLEDDEANFEDEADGAQTGTGDIGDPGRNQRLAQDLFVDGVQESAAGDLIWTIARSPITNNTTGEVGTLFYVSSNQDPFPTMSEMDDVVGATSDIFINPQDSITIGEIEVVSATPYADLICFASGTMIETVRGPRPVDALRIGDVVRTRDHGAQPIRYIASRALGALDLLLVPALRPIEIAPSAGLLAGLRHPIRVSPQHRLVLSHPRCALYFSVPEALVSAKSLLGQRGVRQVNDMRGVCYHHLALDQHAVIFANGAATESLYFGRDYGRFHTAAALREIETLFPALTRDMHVKSAACLPALRPREVSVVLQ